MIYLKNISIWKDTAREVDYPTMNEDKYTDVLIVGGGITGASVFYHLKDSGLKVILCEQNKIGHSVTGSSTGKLTFLQNDLIDKIRKIDEKLAAKYLNSQKFAIDLTLNIIDKEKIECDLKKTYSYIYTSKDNEIEKVIGLEKFLNKCGIKTIICRNDLVDSKYMFRVSDTYLFHPIKFVYGLLSDGDNIYENTSIKKIEKEGNYYICHTNDFKVKCKHVVIASHYPYFTIPYLFPIKGSLEKSYISASKYTTDIISLISYSNPFVSIRNYNDYLLYLSNSHPISSNVDDLKNYKELSKKIIDKKLKPEYYWSNIDIMTNDYLPYVGEIKDNLYIGTGYNTWGMTNGVLAGRLISDLIKGNKPELWDLFDPKRSNLNQALGAFSDIKDSMIGYLDGFFIKNDNIEYEFDEGKKVMIYKDGDKEYKVYHRCPHLGCGLIFNEVEKTFDCPCHGSRFDLEGKCISGPANEDIRVKSIDKYS